MFLVISEILNAPLDEGAKVATYNLLMELKRRFGCWVISISESKSIDIVDSVFNINRMLFNFSFYRDLRGSSEKKLLYIPEASLTFGSIIRAKLLKVFTGKEVIILALQSRRFSRFIIFIIKWMKPELVIVPSKKFVNYLHRIGINAVELPLGVDLKIFREFNNREIHRLRDEYSVDGNKIVLLHIGHICESRNLEWFIEVKQKVSQVEIIIIGSSYSPEDKDLRRKLASEGITILSGYLEKIEELYNIADFYVFPVLRNDGCIETPLSVLEAMACNIPVLVTHFGSLPDTFTETDHFHFINSSEDIVDIISKTGTGSCRNREMLVSFSWDKVATRLAKIIGIQG